MFIQPDGKIVAAGYAIFPYRIISSYFVLSRYNIDGSLDNSFLGDGKQTTHLNELGVINSIALQSNGKIVAAGSSGINDNNDFTLARYNADGNPDTTFGKNGIQITQLSGANDEIKSIAISGDKLYAAGYVQSPGNVGIVARYLLDNEMKIPTVTLSISDSIIKYTAPARIKLNAAVANANSIITKVRFYSDSTFIHTETAAPYGFLWDNVAAGNYTLTAKAFTSDGDTITSNSIKVTVTRPNMPPVVSIANPMHGTTFTGPATVRLIARAHDADDKISKVEIYNGAVLLRTEYYYPYTYNWVNIQPGTYTITAKAYDSRGLSATSALVKITVINAVSRPIVENNKSGISLKLSPNPATDILQVSAAGLQGGKPATISIISASGVVMKVFQANNQNQQINVSSLPGGVYTLKVASGDKITYKQFVKL